MANSRSARKRIRANERKHEHNRSIRSAVRTKVGKARRALLGEETTESQAHLRIAISALDRAAEKGILHGNNAARRKSRLMSLANRLTAAAEGDEKGQSAAREAAVGGQKGRSSRGGTKPAASTSPRARGTASTAKRTSATKSAARSTGRAATGAAPRSGGSAGASKRSASGGEAGARSATTRTRRTSG